MATRTQKAAMKKKAETEKAAKATPKASAKAKPKTPSKAVKPAKAPAPPTPKPAKRATPSRAGAGEPTPKPTLGERFWHRIGLGAKAKEERAHQIHLEHEAAALRKIEQDRRDRERAEEDERAARRAHAAADRKANEKAAREMARIAREEDARLRREAEEERTRAIRQAIEDRKAAAAARREQARTEKLQEAAEAELAEQDKAAHRREAAAARREAARLAREQAEEDAEREGQERAAKRREAAEARREKARQGKLAAEAKAEERRLARQRKAEEKAREEEHKARAEELAQLEAEATARRQAQRMEVTIRQKPRAEPEDAEEGSTGDEESQADESEESAPTRAKANGARGNGAGSAVPTSDLDAQAERVAEELRSRRSKPITLDADDTPVPMLPAARRAREDEPKQVLQLDPAPPARIPEMATPRGLSIPEHFLLLALEDGWDERREKAAAGQLGGALAGSLLLELVLQGKLRVQRDRFQITEDEVDDAASAVAARLGESGDRPSLQAMGDLAKALPQLLPAYKDRLAARGLIEHRAWRHMGMFYRSQTALVDADAQERMRSKLARAIAGGGRPDAPTILSLGLLEASGLFGVVVPEGAQAYNRKRLNGLLAGKDVMGYKVDDELKGIQEMAVRTILDNVRIMTVRG